MYNIIYEYTTSTCGYPDIFHRPFLGVQNLEFHFFFFGGGGGGFRKMNFFLGMKILWIFLWVITKLDWFQGSFLCILGSFLKVNLQNGDNFGVAKISNIFL